MSDSEPTDQGDQYVIPGVSTELADKIASIKKLFAEVEEKRVAAAMMHDWRVEDMLMVESNRLYRILIDLRASAQQNLFD